MEDCSGTTERLGLKTWQTDYDPVLLITVQKITATPLVSCTQQPLDGLSKLKLFLSSAQLFCFLRQSTMEATKEHSNMRQ